MQILALYLILFAGQLNSLQPKHVVHLPPNKGVIETDFGGSLVELINAPGVVRLPAHPPYPDAQGVDWSIEVRNLGPSAVIVRNDATHFDTSLQVGQTINIESTGSEYVLKR